MIFKNNKQMLNSVLSLAMVATGKHNSTITPELSRATLEQNVVRLFNTAVNWNGCALQITTDGFILTADHIFKSLNKDWKTRIKDQPKNGRYGPWLNQIKKECYLLNQHGESYPLDITGWYSYEGYDLALLKAVIPVNPEPLPFRISEEKPSPSQPLSLVTLNNYGHERIVRDGRITSSSNCTIVRYDNLPQREVFDTFVTTHPVRSGDSGSIVLSNKGELTGVTIYSNDSSDDDKCKRGYAGCVRIYPFKELVEYAVADLGRKVLTGSR